MILRSTAIIALGLWALCLSARAQTAAPAGTADTTNPALPSTADSVLADATIVPCSDSVESLLILGDGRVIYGTNGQGITITIARTLIEDLVEVIARTRSVTSVKSLDSCSTLGLIVYHQGQPRYLLINNTKPAPNVQDIQVRIERVRRQASRRMATEIQRLSEKADEADQDTTVAVPPVLPQDELQAHLQPLLVAQQWRCRGKVTVMVNVARDGRAKRAFANEVQAQGRCGPLITAAALRATLLSQYQPAQNARGRPVASWLQVQVPIGQKPK